MAPITIKSLLEGKNFLCSFIAPSIKEAHCYDAWKYVARHFANGRFQIKCVYFNQSYSKVAHVDPFRINISIAAIYILTVSILDVSNAFQNRIFPIHELFCVSSPPYYIYQFEISCCNVPLNQYDVPFFLQLMNEIQEISIWMTME